MEGLTASICQNTAILNKELHKSGHPPLENAVIDPNLISEEAARARLAVLDASESLARLVMGPYDLFFDMAAKAFEIGAIRALMNFGIPQMIPSNGSLPVATLAEKSGLSEDPLVRLIRYVSCYGFLREEQPGVISHTALSSLCAEDSIATNSCLWNLNVAIPVAGKLYEGLKLDPTGTDKTRCPASVAFASKEKGIDTIWDYHRSFPDMEFDFQDYMKATLKSAFYSAQHTVRGFDWSKVNNVVDVGGCAGHISMAIHDQFPHIKFIVEDLGDVIREPQQQLPQRYTDRISFLEHSFFDAQPVTADCYLLRYVLHNWPDEDAKMVIAGLSPALRTGSWVVIADHVLPEPGKTYQSLEGVVRYMDSRMLGFFGSRERSKSDIVDIVQSADNRLTLESCVQPEGSIVSFLVFKCV